MPAVSLSLLEAMTDTLGKGSYGQESLMLKFSVMMGVACGMLRAMWWEDMVWVVGEGGKGRPDGAREVAV